MLPHTMATGLMGRRRPTALRSGSSSRRSRLVSGSPWSSMLRPHAVNQRRCLLVLHSARPQLKEQGVCLFLNILALCACTLLVSFSWSMLLVSFTLRHIQICDNNLISLYPVKALLAAVCTLHLSS